METITKSDQLEPVDSQLSDDEIPVKEPEPVFNPFQCSSCPKSFSTKRKCNAHLRDVHRPPRFKCEICFKTFTKIFWFQIHQATHSSDNTEKKYKCDLCPLSFAVKQRLNKHLFVVHKRKTENVKYFQCEFCTLEFICKATLESHIVKKHVVDKDFECEACSCKFIDQETLQKHMEVHDKQCKYFCDVCSKGFKGKDALLNHLQLEHNKFFYCGKCCRSYSDKSEFDQHFSENLTTTQFNCQSCQISFSSQCKLDIHTNCHLKELKTRENDHHNNQIKIENLAELDDKKVLPSELHKCDICSKTFDRESYFRTHRRVSHRNAEWKCGFEQCSKIFKLYDELRLHKMTHSETKSFKCSVCLKSFFTPKLLQNHEKIHREDIKIKCNDCPKSFTTPYALRIHVANNHGGERPFKCPVEGCGKSSANASFLKIHLISHETRKLFKCEICPKLKGYKCIKELKRHQRKVHSNANNLEK